MFDKLLGLHGSLMQLWLDRIRYRCFNVMSSERAGELSIDSTYCLSDSFPERNYKFNFFQLAISG